jgi:DNA-directed RNA polymerase sigma subunit (sigma70/sigma32)
MPRPRNPLPQYQRLTDEQKKDRVQRTKEWSKQQNIKKKQEKAIALKQKFLGDFPLWDDIKDFLEPNERRVIELYFCLESDDALTLEDIGQVLGISKQAVAWLRDKAVRRIKGFTPKS